MAVKINTFFYDITQMIDEIPGKKNIVGDDELEEAEVFLTSHAIKFILAKVK